jgi:hypothetical protein
MMGLRTPWLVKKAMYREVSLGPKAMHDFLNIIFVLLSI